MGSDDAEAASTSAAVVSAGYRGFDPDALVIGGAERTAERFRELGEMGYTDVIVRNLVSDQAAALRCIERLARVRELLAAD